MVESKAAAGAGPSVIVAISASGADTASLEFLLTHLPPQDGVAVVAVMQHREALNETRFKQALSRSGRELTAIKDGEAIQAGRTYLPDANVIVTVEEGRFHTRVAEQEPGLRGSIDSFLVSLARAEDGRTLVVALAGSDGDGTLGVKAVKEGGGIALAEQTEESREGELASSSGPAALADAVLPIADLTERLKSQIAKLVEHEAAQSDDEGGPETAKALGAIAGILRNRTGHDFHGYKPGTFMRRVQRRMQVMQTDEIADYLEILRTRPEEVQNLFNDLLISVTQFFRDTKEFELLEREVIPKLFLGKAAADQLRVWVVGCATGEEAYTLAILLREHMATLDAAPHVQIFASDLDGRALAGARAGRFADSIAKAMSPERLARWFVREGDTYCVVKELREMCIFSQHSIIKDAPFSRLDLVSCRNLLIYLDADLQSRVIPLFHFSLRQGGFLFLGNSENVSRHTNLFAPIEKRSRIFRRLETGTRVLPDFPFTAVDRRYVTTGAGAERPRTPDALTRRAERFAERYAPAYVLVDAAHNVLHFAGRTGRFIEPAGGTASLNLLQLVHPQLRHELRSALTRAADQKATVEVAGVPMGLNGDRVMVDLVVEPDQQDTGGSPVYFVLFKEGPKLPNLDTLTGPRPDENNGEHTARLEGELRLTQERLQATIEELESTNEELKSSNEEYQSLNEELQSANEELETSKEELQSVNEELTTVNGELAHRVQELTRASSDLKNFLGSTQIATVFLDNDLKVTNFTPAISEIFHIVESDAGRFIGHIKSRVLYDEMQDDAQRVLRTLAIVEREATNPATGARYMVRVLPYRSTDNFIAGVVLTFVDITERQRAEEGRRESEDRFRAIVESARDYAIFTTDTDGRIQEWLPGAVTVFGWTPEEAVGQSAKILYTPEDRASLVFEDELETARTEGVAPNVRWHLRKDGSRIFIEGSARALRDATGRLRTFLKIGQDVTERRRGEEALRESEAKAKLFLAELQHRVRNTLAVVRSIARRTAASSDSVEDYAMHLEGRIDAFARVQAVVTRNPSAGVDFESLVAVELLAYAAKEGEQVVSLSGPKISLQPKAAETLGLAIHELATNAIKHGALSVDGGRVEVRWKRLGTDGQSQIKLEWIETGVGLSDPAPKRRGFGAELLERTLAYELSAETDLRFEKAGLHCTIILPLLDRIVVQDPERLGVSVLPNEHQHGDFGTSP